MHTGVVVGVGEISRYWTSVRRVTAEAALYIETVLVC
jgi:hypothetical protein